MRVLIFNWKDAAHPQTGGAEYATEQFAKYLSQKNHQVTLFTKNFPHALPQQKRQGFSIIRKGNFFSVYLHSFIYYLKHSRDFDIIIDEVHGIPFFSILYTKQPVVVYIHEVAGILWHKGFHWLIGFIGPFMESIYFYLYRNCTFVTDSKSTHKELIEHKIPNNNVYIIRPTIDTKKHYTIQKTIYPSLVYVGRIAPAKQIHLLFFCIKKLRYSFPNIKLFIAGDGPRNYLRDLHNLIWKMHLVAEIVMLGSISEVNKHRLFARSWLHVQPSLKEGFGLTVLEAAAQKTPTVCFNVPGLSENVTHISKSLIAKEITEQSLTQTIWKVLEDDTKRQKLSRKAYRWSKTFPTWAQQTEKFEQLLIRVKKHQ